MKPSHGNPGELLLLLLAAFVLAGPAQAHVGSKDIFEQVAAGPYQLFVTIRPPNVIPGVAVVEVRTSGARRQRAPHRPHAAHRRSRDPSTQL